MLFPTIDFAVFFVVVLTANWLLMPRRGAWKAFMLLASYVFYGWWDPRFTLLLAGSTVGNHVAALLIGRARSERARKVALVVTVAANLGVLAWFKYYGFFATSVVNGLARLGLSVAPPLLQIVLPVGISFFTFHALSYVIDVWRREQRVVPLVDVALYMAFFPHLVAGPIVRATELVPQLRARQDPRHVDTTRAFWLITAGLFKKVVVANLLATELVDRVFANPSLYSGGEVLLAVYGYAVQIYADFSGYTDIAIGVALLLGFTFPQNFDRPYAAVSLQDFWRRWHITLSRWLRDYLYIPLGGNGGSERRTQRNLLLTMLLGGLWHGASWQFVVWGGIHGAGLAVERAVRGRGAVASVGDEAPRRRGVPGAVRWLVTFHVVCLAWVFFRAESFATAWTLLGRLVTGWAGPAGLTPTVPLAWLVLLIALAIAAQFVPKDVGLALQAASSRVGPVWQGVALAVALFVVDALGPEGVAPFIYFQF